MRFLAKRAAGFRRPAAHLGFVLALVAVATVSMAADSPADGSLCDAMSVEELNTIGPLQFDDPEPGSPGICSFVASSGASSLSLVVSGLSFELVRTSVPDLAEVVVGDRSAVAVDGSLHVDLGEGILSVILTLAPGEGATGLDPLEYAIDVAEIVVPTLVASHTTADDPAQDGSPGSPPEVAGISWRDADVVSGEELLAAGEEQAAVWQPLLDSVAVDATQFFLTETSASDADSGERLGSYSAIRLVGIDESLLRSAIIDWLSTVSGRDVGTEAVTLGGKDVTAVSLDGESQGYLYITGDTAHSLSMAEEAAIRVLEAMP
jgi:hypothetical protein